MKHIYILLLLLGRLSNAQYLLPEPKEINFLKGEFNITKEIKVRIVSPSLELNRYAKEFIRRLQFKTGVYFQTNELQDTVSSNEIIITTNSTIKELNIDVNEGYKLNITSDQITINAENNIGAYRALETLLQLIKIKESIPFFKNCIVIDEPRFKWRGLLIDVCRHWIPLHILKRNIDAMAAVKMNVLHLHLTDDQAFRVESKKLPKLHKFGNDGNYFSQKDIKDLVQYAKKRGIRIVPEFDIPSHTTSWLVGYPEIGSSNKSHNLAINYGVFNASLNPTKEYTYEFLDTLITEMCLLFPDAYFHIGGDENNGSNWNQNKKIQKFMVKENFKDNQELQTYFIKRVSSILTMNKKIMVGWDEIFDSNISKSTVIQSWRGKESMIIAAKNGYPSILSNGYYLDKVNKLIDYYENDPLPEIIDLTEDQQKMILGGEAAMWTELVDYRTIESRIWPSSLAIAEKLWSYSEKCNTNKFYDKVPFISNQLQEFGLAHLNYQEVLLNLTTNTLFDESYRPFIDVLEPIRGYQKHVFLKKNKKYSTLTPLNRISDACYVESFTARKFNKSVFKSCEENGYCQNRKDIKFWLAKWAQSAENLIRLSSESVVLLEVKELAIKVQELCILSWRKVNSPSELKNDENQRAKVLISDIETFNLDVHFAPIAGIKIIFN